MAERPYQWGGSVMPTMRISDTPLQFERLPQASVQASKHGMIDRLSQYNVMQHSKVRGNPAPSANHTNGESDKARADRYEVALRAIFGSAFHHQARDFAERALNGEKIA